MKPLRNLRNPVPFLFAALILLLPLFNCGGWIHPSAIKHPLVTILLVALGITVFLVQRLQPLRERLGYLVFSTSRRKFNLLLFLIAATTHLTLSFYLFSGQPTLDDGIGSLFQARIFAIGKIILPLPENDDFFQVFSVLSSYYGIDHWCGMYPPGWPALLVPGVMLGMPWIVTPILGGALVVSTGELGRIVSGKRAGRWAGILALTSPFISVLSSTHLSHTATALFCCLCTICVIRMLQERRLRWGLAAGACWGIAFLCRPLTTLALGVMIALIPLSQPKRMLVCLKPIIAAILIAIATATTLAAFQHITTGDFRTPGHKIGLQRRGKFGFVRLDHRRTHTPRIGFKYTMMRMRDYNKHILGWPLPFYLFALAPFFLLRARWIDWWLLMCNLSLFLLYSAFWYYESYFPGRYAFASLPMLIVLAARGTARIHSVFTKDSKRMDAVLRGTAAGFILFTLTVSDRHYLREHDPNFGDVESVLPEVVRTYGITNAIVFMDAVDRINIRGDDLNDFYATGFMRNDLELKNDIIYARNLQERNLILMKQYPDRNYYLYRYHRALRMASLYILTPDGENSFTVKRVKPTEDKLQVPLD